MILGWGEWGDWSEVVVYKDLKGFEEFDGSVVQPNVGKVVLDVINQLSGSIVGTVIPDAECCGIRSMRAGLNEGVWCEKTVGRIDYQVKCEDDLLAIGSTPLEVMP